jgi:DNA-binding Lrp family transcriptional regulator
MGRGPFSLPSPTPLNANRSRTPMVTAIILINVERHKINEIAELLADMREISEVYSVSGNYDLIAIVRVERNDDLAELVTNHLLKIHGIEKTETLLAFKAYSRHDLEAMFTV